AERQRGLAPAVLVRRVHRREEVQLRDLPDAALLHVLVLVDADAPAGVLAVHGFLRERPPARLRRAAVRRDVNDRLQLHLVEQAAGLRALRTERAEILEHAGLADVHARPADLERAAVGE